MNEENEVPLPFDDLAFSSQESNAGIKWEDIKDPMTNSVSETHYNGYMNTDGGSLSVTTDSVVIATDTPEAFLDNWQNMPLDYWSNNSIDDRMHVTSSFLSMQGNHQASNGIPCKTNWKGEFNFDVNFPKQKAVSGKSASYGYSEDLDKLFISINTSCIAEFQVDNAIPDLFIRCEAQFEKPEDIMQIVKRCPNHERPEDVSNHGFDKPQHLIRCESEWADYRTDQATGRLSVLIPFNPPSVGMDSFSSLYKFMCLGSCVGGINRRPLNLVYTLETIDGKVLGRRVFSLRICACPMRDLKGEEAQNQKRLNGDTKVVKRSSNSKVLAIEPPLKKLKVTGEPEHYQVIFNTTNKSTYEMLLELKKQIELASLVPPEIAKNCLRNQETNLGSGASAAVCSSSSMDISANFTQSFDQNRCETEQKRIKLEQPSDVPEDCGDVRVGAHNHSSGANHIVNRETVEHSTANFTGSQENQNNAGLICISRVSFTRVTSLKRGEHPPSKSQ